MAHMLLFLLVIFQSFSSTIGMEDSCLNNQQYIRQLPIQEQYATVQGLDDSELSPEERYTQQETQIRSLSFRIKERAQRVDLLTPTSLTTKKCLKLKSNDETKSKEQKIENLKNQIEQDQKKFNQLKSEHEKKKALYSKLCNGCVNIMIYGTLASTIGLLATYKDGVGSNPIFGWTYSFFSKYARYFERD